MPAKTATPPRLADGRRPDAGDGGNAAVGDVYLDTADAHDFPALAHRASAWPVSSLIRTSEAFRALAVVACGVISQKLDTGVPSRSNVLSSMHLAHSRGAK